MLEGQPREFKLRWFRHVPRREVKHIRNKILNIKLPGMRKRGNSKRGLWMW